MAQRFSGTPGWALPEWSEGRDRGWEVATLKKYDPHNLCTNPFLDQLMTPV